MLVQVYVGEDSRSNASNNNDNNNPHLTIGDINIDRAGVGLDIGIDFPQDNTSSRYMCVYMYACMPSPACVIVLSG